jgi:hypothetical protein
MAVENKTYDSSDSSDEEEQEITEILHTERPAGSVGYGSVENLDAIAGTAHVDIPVLRDALDKYEDVTENENAHISMLRMKDFTDRESEFLHGLFITEEKDDRVGIVVAPLVGADGERSDSGDLLLDAIGKIS